MAMYVVANCLTGLFVQSVMNYSHKDQHAIIDAEIARREEFMSQLSALFAHMDKDGNNSLSKEEFMKHLSHPRVSAFAASLEIEIMDLERFFDVLSMGGKATVDLETFVVGCIKARGAARGLDMMQMQQVQRVIMANQTQHVVHAEQMLEKLGRALAHTEALVVASAVSDISTSQASACAAFEQPRAQPSLLAEAAVCGVPPLPPLAEERTCGVPSERRTPSVKIPEVPL